MSEEEAEAIRAKNEEIRKQRDEAAQVIADKFACFKRDFMGASIWSAMQAVLNGKNLPKPVQINYRSDEKFWVVSHDKNITVTFELNITSTEDSQLARIFLLELGDTSRVV